MCDLVKRCSDISYQHYDCQSEIQSKLIKPLIMLMWTSAYIPTSKKYDDFYNGFSLIILSSTRTSYVKKIWLNCWNYVRLISINRHKNILKISGTYSVRRCVWKRWVSISFFSITITSNYFLHQMYIVSVFHVIRICACTVVRILQYDEPHRTICFSTMSCPTKENSTD